MPSIFYCNVQDLNLNMIIFINFNIMTLRNAHPISYFSSVGIAFRDGMYEGIGDGNYGNLKAMVAAIVLDREARTPVLDTDPTFGSFREPLIKFVGFMRAMNFTPRQYGGEEVRLVDLLEAIGQQPHKAPNVFSFFLPRKLPNFCCLS